MNAAIARCLARTGIVLLILARPPVGGLFAQAAPQDRELNYTLGTGLRWLEPSRGSPLLVGPDLWPKPAPSLPLRHSFASASSTTSPKPPQASSQPRMTKPPWAEEFSEKPSSPVRANSPVEGGSTDRSGIGVVRNTREGPPANDPNLTRGRHRGGNSTPRKESPIFLSPRQDLVLERKTPVDEGESGVIANPRRPLGW